MPAVDYVEIRLEESAVWEGANTASTPYRLSSNKLYLPGRSARLSPNPEHMRRSDELRGIQAEPAALVETFAPSGNLSVRAYAKELTWLFALAGFTPTVTAGDGVITDPDGDTIPVGAHRWVFTKRDAINAQTAQVAINHKDESVLLKGNGFGVSGLNMNAGGEVTADLVGCWMTRNSVDSSTTPSYASQALPPFRRGELTLDWLSGGGRPSDFSFAIANPLERIRDLSLTPPSNWPNALEHGDGQVQVTGSITKRSLDADDFNALLAATTFAATAKWESSAIIASSYPYSLWIEMPSCQYLSGDADDMANKRRVGGEFGFFAAYDESAGFDVKVTLVNATSAIATYS